MKSWLKDSILLTLIVGLFFGATLGHYPLAAPDGARYSEIPREMVASKDYITPHLNGIKYFEKPPLFYWLQAVSIKAFGVNDLAVSIPNACLALLCVLCLYLTGRKLFGRLQGLLAGLVFATTGLVFALTRIVTLDVALTFFITASLCCFLIATQMPLGCRRNTYLRWMYGFAGCAVMTKGLIGIVFLGLTVCCWLLLYEKWRNLSKYCLISGTIIFLAITLPWHILVQLKNPEFFHFYFIEQHFLRYLTDYAGRSQKWWFFPAALLAGWYPWVAFLGQGIIYHFSCIFKSWRQNQVIVFLGIWTIVIYVFFTFSNSKLIPYILPIFPPLAILLGNYLAACWHNVKTKYAKSGFYILSVLNIILGISGIIASFTLDFNEQAFTRETLLTITAFMFITAIILPFILHRYGMANGIRTLIIAAVCLWLYANPIITGINRQSIKPLINVLQQHLKPIDEVIAYGHYYQELPFYLKRIIPVVNFTGELQFGMLHQDTSSWMIDTEKFWQRWHTKQPIYVIMGKGSYNALAPQAVPKMKVIAKLWDTLLVTNGVLFITIPKSDRGISRKVEVQD